MQQQIELELNKWHTNMAIDIEYFKELLDDNGYVIIPNVLTDAEMNEYITEFNKWTNQIPDLEMLHDIIESGGIFKYHQVGQQRFNWLVRTNPKVQNIFKYLWDTDELVVSFDGCCYYPPEYNDDPTYWTHTDQSSQKKGRHCIQGFVSLTSNVERTLVVYKGSHKLHEQYFKDYNIDDASDWNILDENYVKRLEDRKQVLKVDAGSLVLWDSRTFHQNTCGDPRCNEERLIQYVCYLPKNDFKNDEQQQALRRKYFKNLRTTSHWPYPMNAVPEQPNYYNYCNPQFPINIDYENLPKPKLDDLQEEIEKLI